MSNEIKYKPKGEIIYCYRKGNIQYATFPKDCCEITIIGDLISGKNFYDDVDNGCITDYDGLLGHIFINGYKSNLGLAHKGLMQGSFLVDGETWLNICKNNKVEVEWCNK